MMRPYSAGEPPRWMLIYRWITARLGATILILAGVGILVWTAFRSPQPSPGEMALLALLASTFNIWGGAQFASIGKADAKHARSAERRLYTVGRSLIVASDELRDSIATGDPDRTAERMHVLISQVEAAQSHLLDAIRDWDDLHPEALREVLRSQAMAERAWEGDSGRD